MNYSLLFLPILASTIVSALFPMDRIHYSSLKQSPLTPPDYLFGLVWPILYLLIGYSLVKKPSQWLWINLGLNLAWLVVFNGFKNPKSAFYILVMMIITLLAYLKETQNWLLIPYLLWTLFATYLNGYIAFQK